MSDGEAGRMTDPARQWSDSKYAYACCPGPHARDSAVSIGVAFRARGLGLEADANQSPDVEYWI